MIEMGRGSPHESGLKAMILKFKKETGGPAQPRQSEISSRQMIPGLPACPIARIPEKKGYLSSYKPTSIQFFNEPLIEKCLIFHNKKP